MPRIIISQDRKRATIHYETHSVTLVSDYNVLELINIILKGGLYV